MHALPYIAGAAVFGVSGLALVLFRQRWSGLVTRLDDYARVPESRRRSRPVNMMVAGIACLVIALGWTVAAVMK